MIRTFAALSRCKQLRTVCASALALVFAIGSAAPANAQPQTPELLPEGTPREVIGAWQLVEPPLPCTRSIERIDTKLYMVARCSDNPSADGSKGLPIARLSETAYQGRAGQRYEVRRDGWLYMLDGKHISMRAKPIASPPPR